MAKNRFPVVLDIINVLSLILGVIGCLTLIIAFICLISSTLNPAPLFIIAFSGIFSYLSFSCLYYITKAAYIYIEKEMNKE